MSRPEEMASAAQQGKCDQRCGVCGWTQAASTWCPRCGNRDLEYRVHVNGQTQWCQQALPDTRDTAAAGASGPIEAAQGAVAVSVAPQLLELWWS